MHKNRPITTPWLVGLLLLGLASCSMSSETAAPQGAAPTAQAGSLQGGYLGKDPGAAAPAAPSPARMSYAAAWCVQSLDPGRCRSRAASDHDWCMAHNPDRYDNCRRMMDFVGWHN
jgi:hypothetical protein